MKIFQAVMITLLVSLIIIISIISSASAFPQYEITNSSCNCIIFRMDDIQDFWIQQGQIHPMEVFKSKNLSLSLGIIMNSMGNDSKILNTVRDGAFRNLFEPAIHGWNHVIYTNMTPSQQEESLILANKKMVKLFGNSSDIFIPPENAFNSATIESMEKVGLRIISSDMYNEN
ncbi:MAG TPA: polysaccharide deacetylase family protein, partial [Candidatus Nitrosocosmicus sp.]|nr:polysaccharide deacetylase family protein [Candidatus Nitrosocosmicus sp.]